MWVKNRKGLINLNRMDGIALNGTTIEAYSGEDVYVLKGYPNNREQAVHVFNEICNRLKRNSEVINLDV